MTEHSKTSWKVCFTGGENPNFFEHGTENVLSCLTAVVENSHFKEYLNKLNLNLFLYPLW